MTFSAGTASKPKRSHLLVPSILPSSEEQFPTSTVTPDISTEGTTSTHSRCFKRAAKDASQGPSEIPKRRGDSNNKTKKKPIVMTLCVESVSDPVVTIK